MGNKINSRAYSDNVTFSDGARRDLGEIFKNKPTLLVFLRHFG